MKVAIVYHSPCMDGAAAAWAMAKHVRVAGHEPVFFPALPHTTPDTSGCGERVFVDMCPAVIEERDWVFDHHKTAEQAVAAHGRGFFSRCQSGAGLVWSHGREVTDSGTLGSMPEALQYIQDRDLWAWKLVKAREVSASIHTDNPTPEYIGQLVRDWDLERHIARGTAILEYQDSLVAQIARRAYPQGGLIVVNSPVLQSEVGNRLAEEHQRPALVWRVVPGEVECSLRSLPHLPDVSVIAQAFGGGGHRNAAGFSLQDLTQLETVDITRPSLE